MHRRLLSYAAIFIATLYYFFGRAEAAAPTLPTVSGQSCHATGEKTRMIQCKPLTGAGS